MSTVALFQQADGGMSEEAGEVLPSCPALLQHSPLPLAWLDFYPVWIIGS